MTLGKSRLPQHQTRRVPRQPDGEGFYRVFAGGVRAAESHNGMWYIEPVFAAGHAQARGFFSTEELNLLTADMGLAFIAFHKFGWTNGVYHSSWSPFVPGQNNHMLGPADLWANVAGNLSRGRARPALEALAEPSEEQIAAILDDRTEGERLARSISLSLRNMDLAIEQISEFYFEHLVNDLEAGKPGFRRLGSIMDQNLFAHVHSFYMHLGAARDYLAAFCASTIGMDPKKVDSFAKLIEAIRPEHLASNEILQLFDRRGFLRPKATSSKRFESAGWIKEVTELRNEFMHRRTYGDRFNEQFGFSQCINATAGIYRYVRPVEYSMVTYDIEDATLKNYREMTQLCYAAADASGCKTSMRILTDADIIGSNLEGG